MHCLLDCGLYQGRRKETRERNLNLPVNPASLDAVLQSHAHIDHSGNLPSLAKFGYQGPVYSTPATVDLFGAMLRDSAHIQEKDAEFFNKPIASASDWRQPATTAGSSRFRRAGTDCRAADAFTRSSASALSWPAGRVGQPVVSHSPRKIPLMGAQSESGTATRPDLVFRAKSFDPARQEGLNLGPRQESTNRRVTFCWNRQYVLDYCQCFGHSAPRTERRTESL